MKEFTHKNAIIRVHHPTLTDEEKQQRMKAIHREAANLLIERKTK